MSLSFLRCFWIFPSLFSQFQLFLAILTLDNRLMPPDTPNVEQPICIGHALLEGMKALKSSRNSNSLNLFLLPPFPKVTVWLCLQSRINTWDNTESMDVELTFYANDAEWLKDLSVIEFSRQFPTEGTRNVGGYTHCMLDLPTHRKKSLI